MKTIFVVLFALLSATFTSGNTFQEKIPEVASKDNLIVLSSPELFPVVDQWAKAFNATDPVNKITIVQTADQTQMGGNTTLGFISEWELTSSPSDNAWMMVVGRDVVIPVINSDHPYFEVIQKKGISTDELRQLLGNGKDKTWEKVLGPDFKAPVHVFLKEDKLIFSSLSDYLNIDNSQIFGIKLESNTQLLSELKNDPYAIAFCRLSDVDRLNESLMEKISIIPLDENGNGELDYMEHIYDDMASLSRGIWIGKYPRSLYHNIYSVSASTPDKEEELAFLKWIVTSGQEPLVANGHMALISNEIPSKISKLNDLALQPQLPQKDYSGLTSILIILAIMITLGIVADQLIRIFFKKQTNVTGQSTIPGFVNINSMHIPNGVLFDKSHTWAFMEKEGVVQVGIDDFLQHLTGAFSRVVLKKVGEKVKKGDPVITVVQNGKQLTINSPISGTIKAFNKKVDHDAFAMNTSPYESGWIYMVEPSNWLREKEFLNISAKYKDWLVSELIRFKDFIAHSTAIHQIQPNPIILQDGGEVIENVLSELGPEVWEDFQTHFLDKA